MQWAAIAAFAILVAFLVGHRLRHRRGGRVVRQGEAGTGAGAAGAGPDGEVSAPPEERTASVPVVRSRPAAAPTAAIATMAGPDPRAEDVRFTVYRPAAVQPERWSPLLVFAHRTDTPPDAPPGTPSPAEQVRDEAERVLGAKARSYARLSEDSASPILSGSRLLFLPHMNGVEFNPPHASVDWNDDVQMVYFQLRADAALEGTKARGSLSVYCGPLLLAEMALVLRVSATADAEAQSDVGESVAPYRKVFASYSHRDESIVRQMETYASAFGDEYLRDVTKLRAGEAWNARIAGLIEEADVFQLFWSWNAIESEYVRREIEHAIGLGRPHFIRPVFWEDPLPSAPDRDLPPPRLSVLHFQRLPITGGGPASTGATAQNPGEAVAGRAGRRRLLPNVAVIMVALAGVAIIGRMSPGLLPRAGDHGTPVEVRPAADSASTTQAQPSSGRGRPSRPPDPRMPDTDPPPQPSDMKPPAQMQGDPLSRDAIRSAIVAFVAALNARDMARVAPVMSSEMRPHWRDLLTDHSAVTDFSATLGPVDEPTLRGDSGMVSFSMRVRIVSRGGDTLRQTLRFTGHVERDVTGWKLRSLVSH